MLKSRLLSPLMLKSHLLSRHQYKSTIKDSQLFRPHITVMGDWAVLKTGHRFPFFFTLPFSRSLCMCVCVNGSYVCELENGASLRISSKFF